MFNGREESEAAGITVGAWRQEGNEMATTKGDRPLLPLTLQKRRSDTFPLPGRFHWGMEENQRKFLQR